MIAGSILALSVLSAGVRMAQEAPARPAASFSRELLAYHRNQPVEERVTVTVRDSEGENTSTIILRADRGDQTRPRRLRLELGELIVCVEGERFVAAHAANPDTYFERNLGATVTPALLRTALPPVPVPQVSWALGEEDAPTGWRFWGVGEAINPEVSSTGTTVHLSARAGAVRDAEFVRTPRGLRLARLNAHVASERAARAVTMLVCEPIEAVDPATWMVDTKSRKPVTALTQLRAKPGEVSTGDHLPALGLLTRDLEGWSISRAMDEERARPPRSTARVFAALLLMPRDSDVASVRSAALSLDALTRDFAAMRTRADANSPRLVARTVVLVEPDRLSAARAAEWLEGVPALPTLGEPLLSTAGAATVERLCPSCVAAVVVVDEQLRVVGVARVDRDFVDADRINEQVRRLVSTRRRTDEPSVGPEDVTGSAAGDGPR